MNTDLNLTAALLGWQDRFELLWLPHGLSGGASGPPTLARARVTNEERGLYRIAVLTDDGRSYETHAQITGRMRHEALTRRDFPAVGDWVAVSVSGRSPGQIHWLMPRVSTLARTSVSEVDEQLIAANVDTAFVVSSLNQDLNPRRMERYIAMALEGGVKPVIVLTKSDLCEDLEAALSSLHERFIDVPIVVTSASEGGVREAMGLDELEAFLIPGSTSVFVGTSGVGKSTLLNELMGRRVQKTREVRLHDDRGQHTTTSRQLWVLPGGGLIIDTPGMRALGLWDTEEGVSAAFGEIEELSRHCKFTDCGHASEPGCAVNIAIEQGNLDPERLKSYQKLLRGQDWEERKNNPARAAAAKKEWKARSREALFNMRAKRGRWDE